MKLPLLEDNYELGDELGRGGFGVVYRARRRSDRHASAAKVLLEPPDAEQLARLEREATTLRDLRHPRLVAFHGLFQGADGDLVLVYDEAPGDPLDEVLKGDLPALEAARSWCLDVAEALRALHAAGVVHRDLKPGNLILGPDDHVTLLDFGLARSTDQGATVTAEGLILGTPAYMAPELFRGEPASPASDVYALGCLVHDLAHGRPPFLADNPAEYARLHVGQSAPPLPPWLGTAAGLLAKDPGQRPTAPEVAAALSTADPSATPPSTPARATELDATLLVSAPEPPDARPTRRAVPPLAILGALLLAATMAATLRPPTPLPEPAPPVHVPENLRKLPEDDLVPLRFRDGKTWVPGIAEGPGTRLDDDRIAFRFEGPLVGLEERREHGCQTLVTDLAAGTVQVGAPIQDCNPRRAYSHVLFPNRGGGAWVLAIPDLHTLSLARLQDPLSGVTSQREVFPSPIASIYGVMEPAPGRVVALAFEPRGASRRRLSQIWVGVDGAKPRMIVRRELPYGDVVNGASWSSEVGLVFTIGERSQSVPARRNLLLGSGTEGTEPWIFELPEDFDLQAPALATPQGVYLATPDGLLRVSPAALRAPLTLASLTPVSGPVPDLNPSKPSQLPGQLVAVDDHIDLLVALDTENGPLASHRVDWYRFRPDDPAIPPRVERLVVSRVADARDGTGSVRDLTATGNPSFAVAVVRTGVHHGQAVVLNLEEQQVYRTFPLRYEENDARARGPATWLPYRGGAMLLVATETNTNRAFVFERWFAPRIGPTR